jgi:hypothetical protein
VALVAMKMFSHLMYFVNEFQKFCVFNAICKDNTAGNSVCVNTQVYLVAVFLGPCSFGEVVCCCGQHAVF